MALCWTVAAKIVFGRAAEPEAVPDQHMNYLLRCFGEDTIAWMIRGRFRRYPLIDAVRFSQNKVSAHTVLELFPRLERATIWDFSGLFSNIDGLRCLTYLCLRSKSADGFVMLFRQIKTNNALLPALRELRLRLVGRSRLREFICGAEDFAVDAFFHVPLFARLESAAIVFTACEANGFPRFDKKACRTLHQMRALDFRPCLDKLRPDMCEQVHALVGQSVEFLRVNRWFHFDRFTFARLAHLVIDVEGSAGSTLRLSEDNIGAIAANFPCLRCLEVYPASRFVQEIRADAPRWADSLRQGVADEDLSAFLDARPTQQDFVIHVSPTQRELEWLRNMSQMRRRDVRKVDVFENKLTCLDLAKNAAEFAQGVDAFFLQQLELTTLVVRMAAMSGQKDWLATDHSHPAHCLDGLRRTNWTVREETTHRFYVVRVERR